MWGPLIFSGFSFMNNLNIKPITMSPHFNIRPIQKNDNPWIQKIIIDVSIEFGTYDPTKGTGAGAGAGDPEVAQLYEAYQKPRAHYWVVTHKDNGKVLGGVGYQPLKGTTKKEQICELQKLFLLPEARGFGLGKKLVLKMINDASAEGFQTMYLESVPQMANAVRIYEKLGFEYQPKPLGNTGHFQCSIFMTKKLNK